MLPAETIWRRATSNPDGFHAAPGDMALISLRFVDNCVRMGGVFHAVEMLAPEAFDTAIASFSFYDYSEVSELLRRARELSATRITTEDDDLQFDSEYTQLIPTEKTLLDRFQAHYELDPYAYRQEP